MATSAVDNDIILKGLRYGLLASILAVIPSAVSDVGVLGAAKFVVGAQLRRAQIARAIADAEKELADLLRQATVLEPSDQESQVAAELELAAQKSGLNLDEGESQLCAITIARRLEWLVTGDKRAIAALEIILDQLGVINELSERILCLEQIFLRLVDSVGPLIIRAAVCRDPAADRALATCFSCSSQDSSEESWRDGLASYAAAVRRSAPRLVCGQ